MPRMTTFRSSLLALAGAAMLAGLPTPGAAQATPATHTVRAGDTLWDLARRYLGDAFLWPQIYRLNTQVVEDPHWIYPGEVLRLAPGVDTGPAVPSEDSPAPSMAAAPDVRPSAAADAQVRPARGGEAPVDGTPFWKAKPAIEDAGIAAYQAQTRRPLRRGEFFSSGFLTEGETLPFGRLLGNVTPQQIRNLSERASVALYAHVGLRAPEGATYAVGDTLLTAVLERMNREYGEIVVPTGLVRVIGQSEGQYIGEVVAIFGPMRNGQAVLPAERFVAGGDRGPVAVEGGVAGRVIGGREVRELKGLQNVLFIDVGRNAGVSPGDIFEFRREPSTRPNAADTVDELMATGQVVHVRGRSATIVLTRVVSPDIPPGTLVRQVGKLPG